MLKKDKYLTGLIFFYLVTHLYVYFGTPSNQFHISALQTYPAVLAEHMGEYLLNNVLLPPLTHIIFWIPLKLFGVPFCYENNVFLFVLIFLDLLSVVLIYFSMLLLKIERGISCALCVLFAFCLTGYHLWRMGLHDDHYTFVVMCFLTYSLISYFINENRRSALLLGVSSCLLILQGSSATYLVPVMVVMTMFLKSFGSSIRANWKLRGSIALSILLTIGLLCSRNYYVNGNFTSGSKGGGVLAMFLFYAEGWRLNHPDLTPIRNFYVEAGAPAWYLWCFDNAQIPKTLEKADSNSSDVITWRMLAPAFGICFPWTGSPGDQNRPWPFDYDPLLSKLNDLKETGLREIVEKDRSDAIYKKYLLLGFGPEMTPRWIGVYGKETERLAKKFLREHPMTYLKGVWDNYNQYYYQGFHFFLTTSTSLRNGTGALFFENRPYITEFIVVANRYLLPPLFMIGFFGIIILFLTSMSKLVKLNLPSVNAVPLLCGLVLLYAIFHCSVVTVETDRYFVFSYAFVMVACGVVLQTALNILES